MQKTIKTLMKEIKDDTNKCDFEIMGGKMFFAGVSNNLNTSHWICRQIFSHLSK